MKTLTRQAALAVRNVRLATQLADKAAELEASRAGLGRAEEAERRRIERNIHDGVQQDLVALIDRPDTFKPNSTGIARVQPKNWFYCKAAWRGS